MFDVIGPNIQCHGCGQEVPVVSSWIGGPHRFECPRCHFVQNVTLTGNFISKVEPVTRFKGPASIAKLQETRPRIAEDLQEGLRAANAGCGRAATVMIRRALERACLEVGAERKLSFDKKTPLAAKIKKLEEAGLISAVQASTAHTIRAISNQYGAHPDDDGLDEMPDDELAALMRLAVVVVDGIVRGPHPSQSG